MRPTPFALVVIAAGLVLAVLPALGFVAGWVLWAAYLAALAPLLILDALIAPRPRSLNWSLETPEALHVGVAHTLVLDARLPARWDAALEAELDVEGPLPSPGTARGRGETGRFRLEWPLLPDRRGVVRFETLWMRYRSPLRLWHVVVQEPIAREVPVLPDLPRIRAEALRYYSDREFRMGLKTERYIGDGSEFDSLKEFVHGDDRRAIDWKSTARHRRLLARHHRAERNHPVILTLDTGRLMAEPVAGLTRLDHAVRSALLLAHACLRTGDRVGLFTFDARARMLHPPSGGIHELHALVAAATRVSYTSEETNFTLGLTQLGQHLSRRSLIVLLTEFADTVTAQLMVENVGRLVRRHLVVFVSIRDPALEAFMERPLGSLSDLGGAVVTQTLRRERGRVHLDLRRLGVRVLDVPPQLIAPDLIRQYLDIRRRELV